MGFAKHIWVSLSEMSAQGSPMAMRVSTLFCSIFLSFSLSLFQINGKTV